MRFSNEVMDTDEFERQRDRYEPLACAVRELLDATIRTQVDADVVADAVRAIDSVTAALRLNQLDGPRNVRFTADGRGVTWGNPVIGVHNAFAPPLVIERTAERCWTQFDLGAAYEGPPNHVHGGVSALILDHLLGEAASAGLTKPAFTGTISCRYLRGTPLGALRAEAWIDRVDGIKTYAKGFIADTDGPTVEADGVFIQPVWARDGA
jgi:Thioesterase superfamily